MPSDDSCTCRGCCIFPNGTSGVLALIVGVVAYLLGVSGNNGCFFARMDLSNIQGTNVQGLRDVGFGLWSRESANQNYYCETITSTEESFFVDGKWQASRVMAIIANICGGITMIICICLSCVSIPMGLLKFTSLLTLCAGFFQCLVFIWFANDACDAYDCTFSHSAGLAIGASILYLLNACCIKRIGPYVSGDEQFTPGAAAAQAPAQDPPPGAVQVTVTNLPDGTKKTVRTVVNADGSKTVTETIESPAPETDTAEPDIPIASATAIPSGSAEPVKTY